MSTLGCGGSTSSEPGDASATTADSARIADTSIDTATDAAMPLYCGEPEGALPAWFRATPTKELYVSPTGDDANDGTSSKPLEAAAGAFRQLAPGVRLNFADGNYDGASISSFAGTASAPGWVRASGTAVRFSCAGGIVLDNVHYVALEGLQVGNASGHGVRLMSGAGPWSSATISNDVVIHNMLFHGNGLAGFKASQARAVYVIGNEFLRGNPMRQAIELVAVDDAVIASSAATAPASSTSSTSRSTSRRRASSSTTTSSSARRPRFASSTARTASSPTTPTWAGRRRRGCACSASASLARAARATRRSSATPTCAS